MRIAEFLESESAPLREELRRMLAAYPADAPVFPISLSAGESLLHEDDPAQRVYLLLKGRIAVVSNQPRVSRHTLSEYGVLEFFGEYEILGNFPRYIAEVRALSACRLISFPADAYLIWMHSDPECFFAHVRHILENLLYQTASERSLHFLDASDRVIQFLIRAYEKGGGPPGLVRVPETRAAIAETTGNNVRTINRAVSSLSEEGLVTVKNGKIQLTAAQYEGLRQKLESFLKS